MGCSPDTPEPVDFEPLARELAAVSFGMESDEVLTCITNSDIWNSVDPASLRSQLPDHRSVVAARAFADVYVDCHTSDALRRDIALAAGVTDAAATDCLSLLDDRSVRDLTVALILTDGYRLYGSVAPFTECVAETSLSLTLEGRVELSLSRTDLRALATREVSSCTADKFSRAVSADTLDALISGDDSASDYIDVFATTLTECSPPSTLAAIVSVSASRNGPLREECVASIARNDPATLSPLIAAYLRQNVDEYDAAVQSTLTGCLSNMVGPLEPGPPIPPD